MVASINPVRYPGGKAKLAPLMRDIIGSSTRTWVEPFCGGCGLALSLISNGDVEDIVLNDFDRRVYAMWHDIVCEPERLISDIVATDITVDRFYEAKDVMSDADDADLYALGLNTFIVDRCARSGYLNGGPIGGKEQTGDYKVDCRLNKRTLPGKIRAVAAFSDHITLSCGDWLAPFDEWDGHDDATIYLDPPYYQKGKDCYIEGEFDHDAMAERLRRSPDGRWILSYDDIPEVRSLYDGFTMSTPRLRYSSNNSTRGIGNELLVTSHQLDAVMVGIDEAD